MMDLKGKNVLITGGSRGIGAALALGFADVGAAVAITYRSARREALACARKIEERGAQCLVLNAKVEKISDVRKVIRKVVRRFGRIDILVNNAGIWKEAAIGKMSEREWDETLDINLKGPFLFCNETAPVMKEQDYGKIINISSTAGQRGEPLHSHYAASKGGIIAFTKSIAVELAPFNINVNSVSPGWIETDMTRKTLSDASIRREINKAIPRGEIGHPKDIVGAVLFLASDVSKHVIGATINVNGGSVLF